MNIYTFELPDGSVVKIDAPSFEVALMTVAEGVGIKLRGAVERPVSLPENVARLSPARKISHG